MRLEDAKADQNVKIVLVVCNQVIALSIIGGISDEFIIGRVDGVVAEIVDEGRHSGGSHGVAVYFPCHVRRRVICVEILVALHVFDVHCLKNGAISRIGVHGILAADRMPTIVAYLDRNRGCWLTMVNIDVLRS